MSFRSSSMSDCSDSEESKQVLAALPRREELADVLGVSNPLREAISRRLNNARGRRVRGSLRSRLKRWISVTVDQYDEMIRVRMGFLPPQPVQAAVQERRLVNNLLGCPLCYTTVSF